MNAAFTQINLWSKNARRLFSILIVTCLLIPLFSPYAMASGGYGTLSLGWTGEVYTLPNAIAGVPYTFQFEAEGGTGPITWQVEKGELPQGLKLENNGKLSGLVLSSSSTEAQFSVLAVDTSLPPQRSVIACRLTVQPAPLKIKTTVFRLDDSAGRISGGFKISTPVSSGFRGASLPTADVKQGALAVDTSESSSAGRSGNSNTPEKKSETSGEAIVWGRLHPAMFDEVMAFLPTLETFSHAIQEPTGEDNVKEPWKMSVAELWKTVNRQNRLTPDCTDCSTLKEGVQKDAAVELLTRTLRGMRAVAKSGNSGDRERISAAQDLLFTGDDMTAMKKRFSRVPTEIVENVILQLRTYLGNLTVFVEDEKNNLVANGLTDKDGSFQIKIKSPNSSGAIFTISTEGDSKHTKRSILLSPGDKVKINLPMEDRPVSLMLRAILGYQQGGAASFTPEQNYFFDLFVSHSLPFNQRISPNFGEDWRAWGAIRAISVPQSGNATLLDTKSNFVTNVANLKLNEAARVFDYLGGVEYRLVGNQALLPSFDRNTKQKFSLSVIASFGFVTPTNPLEKEPAVYRISEQLKNELNPQLIKDKKYVSFVPMDRDRFYRQYYAGLRMQGIFFSRNNTPLQRFPAQIDFTLGQNEYVTGGKLRGPVFRLDGYLPLPYEGLKFINLFYTAVFKPSRAQQTAPLLLEQITDVKPFSTDVSIIPVRQFNRDYYRVGVGIDVISFIQKLISR